VKVIIAGGRDFVDYATLCLFCDKALSGVENIEIVSGTARGADKLGEKYARENEYNLSFFPADWEKYGKSAGYKRNRAMAQYADILIAFWDGESKGTRHMIDLAYEEKLTVVVCRYNYPQQ